MKYYSKRFKEIADEIENIRLEIYSSLHINIDDPDDKSNLDDILFMTQSKLRYDVVETIECYEDVDVLEKLNNVDEQQITSYEELKTVLDKFNKDKDDLLLDKLDNGGDITEDDLNNKLNILP